MISIRVDGPLSSFTAAIGDESLSPLDKLFPRTRTLHEVLLSHSRLWDWEVIVGCEKITNVEETNYLMLHVVRGWSSAELWNYTAPNTTPCWQRTTLDIANLYIVRKSGYKKKLYHSEIYLNCPRGDGQRERPGQSKGPIAWQSELVVLDLHLQHPLPLNGTKSANKWYCWIIMCIHVYPASTWHIISVCRDHVY
jgi:hypothetical protein